MNKKVFSIILCLMMSICLFGCSMDTSIKVNKDGSASTSIKVSIEKEIMDSMEMSEDEMVESGYQLVNVNGVDYYEMTQTQEMTAEELKDEYTNIFPTYCIMKSDDISGMSEADGDAGVDLGMTEEELEEYMQYFQFSVNITFPYKISKTNGTLSADKKTVTWDLENDNTTVYAFTTKYKDTTAPKVNGVANGKTYTKAVKVKYSDNSIVKSAKLDGKSFKSGKKVSAKGEHTVVVTDIFGNKKTVKFTIK